MLSRLLLLAVGLASVAALPAPSAVVARAPGAAKGLELRRRLEINSVRALDLSAPSLSPLRGGSNKEVAMATITISAIVALAIGLVTIFAPEHLKTLTLGGLSITRKDLMTDLFGVGMLAWVVGKFTAMHAGKIEEFAVFNLGPLSLAVFLCWQHKNKIMAAEFGVFFLAYFYVGFF